MAARKRMTNKEKQRRAAVKKELQEKGILPPDKPRLNRKRFVEEAERELREIDTLCEIRYLYWAILEMLAHKDKSGNISQEAVGAAKCVKLAMRRKEFMGLLMKEGRDTYKQGELIDFVMDIYEA